MTDSSRTQNSHRGQGNQHWVLLLFGSQLIPSLLAGTALDPSLILGCLLSQGAKTDTAQSRPGAQHAAVEDEEDKWPGEGRRGEEVCV